MKKSLAAFLILAVTLFFCPVSAAADDAPVTTIGGTGVTVYPIFDTNIVMEKEIIDISVEDGTARVACQFFFHNTGDAVSLMMGFPSEEPGTNPGQYPEFQETGEDEEWGEEGVNGEEYGGYDDTRYETWLGDFTTTINGKNVPVTLKEGLTPEGYNDKGLYFPDWYTWNMDFKAGERVKVENSYTMTNSSDGEGTETVKYILRSGAAWEGPIGNVLVRMKLRGYEPDGLSFGGMQPTYIDEAGTICWEAENLEPDKDITVYCGQGTDVTDMTSPFAESDEYYDSETVYEDDEDTGTLNPEAQENLNNDTAYNSMAKRMMENFNAKHYRGAIWWAQKMIRRFGDMQAPGFYYYMGKSYEKLHLNTKAAEAYEQIGRIGFYYEAMLYKRIGWKGRYITCLRDMVFILDSDWTGLWAKSRLRDFKS